MRYIGQLNQDMRRPNPDPESMRLTALGIQYAILPEMQRGQFRNWINPANPFRNVILAGRIRHEAEMQEYEHFLARIECALLWGTFNR